MSGGETHALCIPDQVGLRDATGCFAIPIFWKAKMGRGDKMGGSPDQKCRDTLDRPILSVGRPGGLP